MRDLRPTSNLVLQAIFNILYSVKGKDFLDLFAGTGQVGIKALEKGAKSVVFVDIEKKRIEDIKKKAKNYANTNFIVSDALKFLKTAQPFDVIFADPPYDYKFYDKLIKLSFDTLKEGGILIVEHRSNNDLSNILPDDFLESRKYGDTVISFWRKE
ncbi:RsmD family RNA methyltransferase [Sulfurihydrogenibium subterraneum]|uniref:RsmD family RNA methyltransferase n=1 Tax=Sulfurihydrogenibium subterraneum TaxID=171121 RepID=UPI0004901D9A|nr:RsmD family RNA methyltransferase [Sulfurihydrogenibium subterraneum]